MGLLQAVDDSPGLLLIGRHAERGAVHLRDIQHMVRDPFHLLPGGLGGADIQAPVDLDGIRREDLCAQALGYLHPQGGLAAGGRPQDDPQGRFFYLFHMAIIPA